MKILLLGEYSSVYAELSKGFRSKGHECYTISDGDSFKKFKSDYVVNVQMPHPTNFLGRIYRHLLYRLGLDGLFHFFKIWPSLKMKIRGYDAVLFINPIVISAFGSIPNLILAYYVNRYNKNIYLSVLGDDFYVQRYFGQNNLQNGFYNSSIKLMFHPTPQLKYKYCLFYKMLNKYLLNNSKGILPGTYLYAQSYSFSSKLRGVLPFPISANKLGRPIRVEKDQPIVIFHGWQKGKGSRKGNDVFDRVIKRVVQFYGENRVKYEVVSNVPYDTYIQLFSNCHIFIDQLYGSDKGVNGLLGMAAGKVVFSGFQPNILKKTYCGYKGELIGIESYKDEEYLYNQFCNLIDNPNLLETISRNAIDFVKQYHLVDVVVSQYLEILES